MRLMAGIDLDGIVYNWDSIARFLLEYEFNLEPLQYPLYWDHIKDQVTEEQWKWLWTDGVKRGLFRHGHLWKGSVEALTELQDYLDITIITHRPDNAKFDTLDWLAFHKIPANRVVMLHNGEPKSSQDCALYLDDNADVCLELAESTDSIVCMWRRPWNEYLPSHEKIVVIDDWQSLITIAKEIV